MSIAEEESTREYCLLEGPEHGEVLREKLLAAALENRHVIAQREAYVAGRTAKPTEAEIDAALPELIEAYRQESELVTDRDYVSRILLAARKAVAE